MNNTEATKLMYAVLDGGASPEERSALERALAADPQLREEFDGLRRMFAELDGMPRYDPPPGFAERVVALQRSMSMGDPARQLSSRSGVIGPSGKDISVRNPSVNATRPRTPSESIWGNWQMAMSKRGMWIVGGVAAAVAAMFIGGVVDFPASGDKATGTIAPAKKAKGEQPGTDDLKRRAVDQDDNLRRGKSEPGPGGATPVAGAGGGAGGASGGELGAAAGGGGRGATAGGDVGAAAGGGGRGGSSGGDVGAAAGGGGRAGSGNADTGAAAGGGGRAGSGSADMGAAAGGGGRAGSGSADMGAAAGGGGRAGSGSADMGAAAGGGGRGATAGGDVGAAAGGGGRGGSSGGDVGAAAGGGGRAGGSASAVGSASGGAVGAADAKAKK